MQAKLFIGAATAALALLGTLIAPAARAQTVTVTNLTQMTMPVLAGQETLFSGTLTNTDVNSVLLGGLTIGFDSAGTPYLTADTSDYDNNVNGLVSLDASGQAGDSYTGTLFGILTDPSTPAGDYNVNLSLADNNGNILASPPDFTVSVAAPAALPPGTNAVPEPAPLSLLAAGGLLMLLPVLRQRRGIIQADAIHAA